MLCRICGGASTRFGTMQVLGKYQVSYFRCGACDFIQTEEPFWLEEAYSEATCRQDVGVISRNELNASLTRSVLSTLFPKVKRALDFGGGHGVFVRMMRDRGFDFYWRDLYAANHFARGFEYDPEERYDFLTAFEVMEHFVDPMSELEALMAASDNLFVSTLTVSAPPPALGHWWYYVPSTGQHVSFYARRTLELIARRFGRHLQTTDAYHLFTKEPCSSYGFRLATNARAAKLIGRVTGRRSLMPADFERFNRESIDGEA